MGQRMTTRQRRVLAGCVNAAAQENGRFPLPADKLADLVRAVGDGSATDEQMEAAATIAAFAPHAQPDCSSADWHILSRALSRFEFNRLEPHPYWRDLVHHHLAIGAYSK